MSAEEAAGGTTRLLIMHNYQEMSRVGLQIVVETLRRRPDARISLTTGRTPAGLYRGLRTLCHAGRTDISRARLVSSEEYAGVAADDPISLIGWLRRDLLGPCGVRPESVLRLVGDAPDLDAECRRFDAAIAAMGGLDLVVQSIGVNGHFGFNEPGSAWDADSRVAALAPSTWRSNARYWRDGARVPGRGLTMGLRPTLQAGHIVLLASGAAKARALAEALDGPIDAAVPCSLFRLASRFTVIADRAAASRLEVRQGSAWEG